MLTQMHKLSAITAVEASTLALVDMDVVAMQLGWQQAMHRELDLLLAGIHPHPTQAGQSWGPLVHIGRGCMLDDCRIH